MILFGDLFGKLNVVMPSIVALYSVSTMSLNIIVEFSNSSSLQMW